MKKIVFAILLLMVSTPSFANTDKYKSLEQYLDLLQKHDKAMVSVAIQEKGQHVFSEAIGFSNYTTFTPATPGSKYRIGSISKTYTAVVILKLIEQGKLALDTNLATFYPQIPNAKLITIQQLLSHRSGIFNFTNAPEYQSYMTQAKNKSQLIEIISKFDSQFEPGSQYEYSNSGYVLLGFIAEDVSNQPFSELIDTLIVKKLNQSHSYLGVKPDRNNGEVLSYRFANGWQPTPVTSMSIPRAAGAMISTAQEVNEFFYALFNNKLLSENSFNLMIKLKDNYGLGITRFPFYDKWGYGHNGGIDGFVSSAAYFRADDVTVTVLSNGLNMGFNDIMIAVLSHVFERPFELPDYSIKPLVLSAKTLKQYEGTFVTEQLPMDIRVFLEGETLMAQATGQGAFPLSAFEGNEFRFETAGIVLKFNNLAENRYDAFTLLQGGGVYTFTRKN